MTEYYYLGVDDEGNCCFVTLPVELTEENLNQAMRFALYSFGKIMYKDTIDNVSKYFRVKVTEKTFMYDGRYNYRFDYGHGDVDSGTFYFNKLIRVV